MPHRNVSATHGKAQMDLWAISCESLPATWWAWLNHLLLTWSTATSLVWGTWHDMIERCRGTDVSFSQLQYHYWAKVGVEERELLENVFLPSPYLNFKTWIFTESGISHCLSPVVRQPKNTVSFTSLASAPAGRFPQFELPNSRLCPHPTLAIVSIWGVNRWIEALCFSLFLCPYEWFSNKLIFKNAPAFIDLWRENIFIQSKIISVYYSMDFVLFLNLFSTIFLSGWK